MGAYAFAYVLGGSVENALEALHNTEPNTTITKAALLLQIVSGSITFLITPLIFLSLHKERMLFNINTKSWTGNKSIVVPGLCILGFLFLIPVSDQLYVWSNKLFQNFELFGLSSFVKAQDEAIENGLSIITNFDTPLNFFLGILAIAVIAPVGEELLFRGIVQNLFLKLNVKPWTAILVTALIFSIIHFNFNGFTSRFVLGAVLGLAYYKSGNILVPIMGHVTNNLVLIVFTYLTQHSILDPNWIGDQMFTTWQVGLSGIVAILIYWVFAKQTKEYDPRISHESLGKDTLN
jgi:membrane protease YdiL (CAAX protease family)